MGTFEQLLSAIETNVKTNGNQEITGGILQLILKAIVNTIGSGATFAGVATPSSNPQSPDANVFYIASTNGTYTNFGGIVINNEIAILSNGTGDWVKHSTGAANTASVATLTSSVTDIAGRTTLHKTAQLTSIGELNAMRTTEYFGVYDVSIEGMGYGIAIISNNKAGYPTQTLIMQSFTTLTFTQNGAVVATRYYANHAWTEWSIMPIAPIQRKFVLPFGGILTGAQFVTQGVAPAGAIIKYMQALGRFAAEADGVLYSIFPDVDEYQDGNIVRENKMFVFGNAQYSVFNGVWTRIN